MTSYGRVSDDIELSQAEPVSRLGPSGFDPSRERLVAFVRKVANYRFAPTVSEPDVKRFARALRELRRDAANLLDTLQ